MVGHRGSSAGLYLADPTSPIPSHCASIVTTSTLRANSHLVAYSTPVEYCTICVIQALRLYHNADAPLIVNSKDRLCRSIHSEATIHQLATMLATSKNVLFPCHNHLLTTGTDDPSLSLTLRQ